MKEPNVYAKMLDALMKAKAKRMRRSKYYSEKDSENLLAWGKKRAKAVWSSMLKQAHNGNLILLFGDECPFCQDAILRRGYGKLFCEHCRYGKVHGKCDTLKSDFSAISLSSKQKLTSEWYTKTFLRIKKEFLGE